MCKKMIKAAFVAAIAMVSGINAFNAQKSEVLSDTVLANVEALADSEYLNGDCIIYCQPDERYSCYIDWGNGTEIIGCRKHRKA